MCLIMKICENAAVDNTMDYVATLFIFPSVIWRLQTIHPVIMLLLISIESGLSIDDLEINL